MEIAIPMGSATNFTSDLVRNWVQSWVNSCNAFRKWERQELIEKVPSPETTTQHRKLVSAFIRTAYMLEALMEDPEYPAREFLPEVQGKLLQLTDTREMIHDSMPEEEAERLLKKIFPD